MAMNYITSHPMILNNLPSEPTTSMLRQTLIAIIHSPDFLTHKISTVGLTSSSPGFFGDGISAAYNNYTVHTVPAAIVNHIPEARSLQVLVRTAKRIHLEPDGRGTRTRFLIAATIRVWSAAGRTVVLPLRFDGDAPEQAAATIRTEWWEGSVPVMDMQRWDVVVLMLKTAVGAGFEASGSRRGFDIDQVSIFSHEKDISSLGAEELGAVSGAYMQAPETAPRLPTSAPRSSFLLC